MKANKIEQNMQRIIFLILTRKLEDMVMKIWTFKI